MFDNGHMTIKIKTEGRRESKRKVEMQWENKENRNFLYKI